VEVELQSAARKASMSAAGDLIISADLLRADGDDNPDSAGLTGGMTERYVGPSGQNTMLLNPFSRHVAPFGEYRRRRKSFDGVGPRPTLRSDRSSDALLRMETQRAHGATVAGPPTAASRAGHVDSAGHVRNDIAARSGVSTGVPAKPQVGDDRVTAYQVACFLILFMWSA